MAGAGEMAQELVIQARRLQHGAQLGLPHRIVIEHGKHVGVLVAKQELDHAVLLRLEPRGRPEHMAELLVLGWRQGFQHRPLLEQLALDLLDPGEDLQARIGLVGRQQCRGRPQFVDDQLHPQFADVVLDDEQHLVMVGRLAERLLRGQQGVQLQVATVVLAISQIDLDALFEFASVFHIGSCKHRE